MALLSVLPIQNASLKGKSDRGLVEQHSSGDKGSVVCSWASEVAIFVPARSTSMVQRDFPIVALPKKIKSQCRGAENSLNAFFRARVVRTGRAVLIGCWGLGEDMKDFLRSAVRQS